MIKLKIGGKPVKMKGNTGAEVNVIPFQTVPETNIETIAKDEEQALWMAWTRS